MALQYRHEATLLAQNGNEQDVILRIDAKGVALYVLEGTTEVMLSVVMCPHLARWIPAVLRRQMPGPASCLDMQLQTSKGLKDMRIRFADRDEVRLSNLTM